MEFSVLLSVYKKEKPQYLQIALQSISDQSLIPNEIIIVKDGLLTADLDKVIADFAAAHKSQVKILSFAENRGLGSALRDGVLACKHEYIARMDADDIAVKNRFERQINYLMSHPELSLLGSWITEFFYASDRPDTLTRLPCTQEEIIAYAKKRNPFRHMTVVFSKRAVLDCGNYRNFQCFEDYDLWVRMLQKGYKAANLPEVLVNVRADGVMFARRGGWSYLRQELKFQKLLYENDFIDEVQFIGNILIRSFVRILPNGLRTLLYRKFLRNGGIDA